MPSGPAKSCWVQRAGKRTLMKVAEGDSGSGGGWPAQRLVKHWVGSSSGQDLPADEADCVLFWL